jgi:hypothetical protein
LATAVGNLDRHAQRTWLRMGVAFVAVALVLAVILGASGASAFARLVVFVPLFLGVYGLRAGLEKTCGFCAIARRRIAEDGPEPVTDPAEIQSSRRVGMRVIALSAGVAAVGATLLAIAR